MLQALVEHYDEYRDYNTTTTQSDYGENIHILLDFLRLKVRYDRYRVADATRWHSRTRSSAGAATTPGREVARVPRREDHGPGRGLAGSAGEREAATA